MHYQWLIRFALFPALLFLAACSSAQTRVTEHDKSVQCQDPRPRICTMNYDPVCGLHKDHSTKTYSNGCAACANAEVISWSKGQCPETAHTLTREEVLKLFSGNTYVAEIPSRNITMTVYVDPDGTLRGMQNKHKFTSKWAVNDRGEMCVSYKTRLSCRNVIEQNGQYKKIKTTDSGEKIVLIIYHSFTPGNPNNY